MSGGRSNAKPKVIRKHADLDSVVEMDAPARVIARPIFIFSRLSSAILSFSTNRVQRNSAPSA
jgi:hypothetical protein